MFDEYLIVTPTPLIVPRGEEDAARSLGAVWRDVLQGFVVENPSPFGLMHFLSFSEDDCTRQRGLKAVVQSSIERTVSGVHCTNDDLKPVLVALATDQPLDVRYRDHDLSGDWAGYRECHIKPDLLLIYRKSDADTLRLARLGSHSELFG